MSSTAVLAAQAEPAPPIYQAYPPEDSPPVAQPRALSAVIPPRSLTSPLFSTSTATAVTPREHVPTPLPPVPLPTSIREALQTVESLIEGVLSQINAQTLDQNANAEENHLTDAGRLGPALFQSLDRMVFYDQDPQVCLRGLREERGRLVVHQQLMELELVRQQTAQLQLKIEQLRQDGEARAQSHRLNLDNTIPSLAQANMLSNLDDSIVRVRQVMDRVVMLEEGVRVPLAYFRETGCLYQFDHNRRVCLENMRSELHRITMRRDLFMNEMEKQRTASLVMGLGSCSLRELNGLNRE